MRLLYPNDALPPWIAKISGTPQDWVKPLTDKGVPLPEGVSAEATAGGSAAAGCRWLPWALLLEFLLLDAGGC